MTAIGGIEPPHADSEVASDKASQDPAGVQEFVIAPESSPTDFVELAAHPVLPATDHAAAQAIKEVAARERRKDQARPWLLVGLGGIYVIMIGLGMWAAWTGSSSLDNLLRLYAIVMPVLTAAMGAAAAYYFTASGGRR